MKKVLILLICVLLCLIFIIGRQVILNKVEISDSSLKVTDLITIEYSEEDLKYMSSLDYSLRDYNKKYHIECLREENDLYKLVYSGDLGYLVIYFDKNGKKVFNEYVKKSISYEMFKEIENGMFYEEVMEIDENGNYVSFYVSSTTEYYSEHYTSDGYYIIIEYDNDLKVSNVIDSYI